jgi:hypothetical protein
MISVIRIYFKLQAFANVGDTLVERQTPPICGGALNSGRRDKIQAPEPLFRFKGAVDLATRLIKSACRAVLVLAKIF